MHPANIHPSYNSSDTRKPRCPTHVPLLTGCRLWHQVWEMASVQSSSHQNAHSTPHWLPTMTLLTSQCVMLCGTEQSTNKATCGAMQWTPTMVARPRTEAMPLLPTCSFTSHSPQCRTYAYSHLEMTTGNSWAMDCHLQCTPVSRCEG
jgi:hypothetical protein